MFCAECGLEIQGKNFHNKGESLCMDCHERQTKKAVLHRTVESEALSNQMPAPPIPSQVTTETGTVTRANNPFTSEDTYAQHVKSIRNTLVLPRLLFMGALFFLFMLFFLVSADGLFALVFLGIYALIFGVTYYRFYHYTPDIENLVIAEGIVKRRFFRSKNDDRGYKIIQIHNIKNLSLINPDGKPEVSLRGVSKQVNPYLDQEMTYYIDAKLQLILACKNTH